MLYEFFFFDTFLFWGALAIPVAFLCYFTFNEKGAWSTFTVAATVAVIVLFSNLHILSWLRSLTVGEVILYAGGYIVIGFTYMVLKWIYNTFEIKSKYTEYREEWLRYNKLVIALPSASSTDLNEQKILASFKSDLYSATKIRIDDLPPKIRNHRGDLIFWACYWHLSLIFTLLNNPLRHLVTFIINLSTKPLNAISAAMFKDFNELK